MNILTRIALIFLFLNALMVGAWAQFAPQSFYNDFPNFSWSWISIDGPYNEHLVRDVGGLNLAIAALVALAWFNPSPVVLLITAIVTLAFQLPHNIYHLLHIGVLPNLNQQISQTMGLFLGMVASLVVWAGSRKPSLAK